MAFRGKKRATALLPGPGERQPPSKGPQPGGLARRLFLHVGDRVFHRQFKAWGRGVVMETCSSELSGGTCLVRIRVQDGKVRIFDNSLDSGNCCSRAGIALIDRVELT
jgi:hypothetical protein